VLLAAARASSVARVPLRWATDRVSNERPAHLAFRTRAIDEALRASVESGVRQVVVLGAGLDGRPHRLTELAECTVFEVDHPASQRYKQRRAVALPRACAALHYVPVDFERVDLRSALASAGHEVAAPSFWIWEGVTMYLSRASVTATLRAIHDRSARGSRVAVTYLEPPRRRADVRSSRIVESVGEPYVGHLERDTARALFEEAGFVVMEDAGDDEWAHRWARPLNMPFSLERLAVLERA
jgi:methyltransferase (TIGR00027 family)